MALTTSQPVPAHGPHWCRPWHMGWPCACPTWWMRLVITGLCLALVNHPRPDPDPDSLAYISSLALDLPYHHRAARCSGLGLPSVALQPDLLSGWGQWEGPRPDEPPPLPAWQPLGSSWSWLLPDNELQNFHLPLATGQRLVKKIKRSIHPMGKSCFSKIFISR